MVLAGLAYYQLGLVGHLPATQTVARLSLPQTLLTSQRLLGLQQVKRQPVRVTMRIASSLPLIMNHLQCRHLTDSA